MKLSATQVMQQRWLRWYRSGSPWVWLNAGAVVLCLLMMTGLVLMIAVRGFGHFWTPALVAGVYHHPQGTPENFLGRLVTRETADAGVLKVHGIKGTTDERWLVGFANRDLAPDVFQWLWQSRVTDLHYPSGAMIIERSIAGDFYGYPEALLPASGEPLSASHPHFREQVLQHLQRQRDIRQQIKTIERKELRPLHQVLENVQQQKKNLLSTAPANAPAIRNVEEQLAVVQADYAARNEKRIALLATIAQDQLQMRAADGQPISIGFDQIHRLSWPNDMTTTGRLLDYLEKFYLFLSESPREANTSGGIYPAIFGTLVMVIIMSLMVAPLGVLAAIFLHEYARQGWFVRMVRISVYNLAGVPSIVYGIFGLGFFVYVAGGAIDRWFYASALPSPVFGTPGLFWVSLTMALLTLPVVIVSTEEGLSRIPVTIRHGSFALGATRSETIWKVVVPLATPAMVTGLILAVARAAGEVAPLMLVGVVKLAPALPIDGEFPYIHPDRKIMHLGYHIYDTGFQSANIDATYSLVYASSLILLLLVVLLNITAIRLRNNLRRKYRHTPE